METPKMETPATYKAAITELEQILGRMESDQCDIDSLSGYTARALELLKFCKERLFKTDTEITKCLEELRSTLGE